MNSTNRKFLNWMYFVQQIHDILVYQSSHFRTILDFRMRDESILYIYNLYMEIEQRPPISFQLWVQDKSHINCPYFVLFK